jgi:pimeloyl-ACP methyl ester carboxylesterase
MPEISNDGVRIVYDVLGQGRPLILLHGWCCDRSWWTEPGYVEVLRRDHLLINMDLRGHGASDKPHEPAAYRRHAMTGDVLAVADAEGLERFAIWGQSYGGEIAWMTADAVPERVPGIVTSGAWDPRPYPSPQDRRWFDEGWGLALRRGGTRALVALFEQENGEAFEKEFPAWAQAVTLRADPEALLAAFAPERWTEGLSDLDLERFPVPALLIAGDREDEDDEAAKMAGMIPNGQSLRLPGLGHAGACAASELTIPTARLFLDRWFAWDNSGHS